jgi:hypothetical protein
MPATHRLGDQVAAHSSRYVCGHGCSKEDPHVPAIAGAGALDRNGNADRSASFGERRHIVFPTTLVKVNCKKPTGLFFEEWVDAHDVPTLQMFDEKLVANRDKILIRAIAALPSGPEQASRFPLVEARGSVACLPRLFAHEPKREHIPAAAK